jgi:hypothetical protein
MRAANRSGNVAIICESATALAIEKKCGALSATWRRRLIAASAASTFPIVPPTNECRHEGAYNRGRDRKYPADQCPRWHQRPGVGAHDYDISFSEQELRTDGIVKIVHDFDGKIDASLFQELRNGTGLRIEASDDDPGRHVCETRHQGRDH